MRACLQVGLSLGVVGVSVDSSGQYGAAASLDSYVTVWSMGDYSTGQFLILLVYGWLSPRCCVACRVKGRQAAAWAAMGPRRLCQRLAGCCPLLVHLASLSASSISSNLFSAVHQFTDIPPSETWGLAFAPPAAGGDDKLLLAVAGGSSNSVRLLDVNGKAEVGSIGVAVAA